MAAKALCIVSSGDAICIKSSGGGDDFLCRSRNAKESRRAFVINMSCTQESR